MAISVVMPALEVAQETGKLVAWLKKEGDTIRKGEMLLEIETDKAIVEVDAAADGVLANVTGVAGTDIPVGQVIAWILSPGESLGEVAPANSATTNGAKAVATDLTTPVSPAPPSAVLRPGQASPKARRLAKEAGIDLSTVRGSGENGEILASDVQALVDAKSRLAALPEPVAPAATPIVAADSAPAAKHEALSTIGRLMAERTTQSWTTVPHFFVQREIDASALNRARGTLGAVIEQTHGVKLTHTDLLIALVGRLLAKHPSINGSWIDDGIRLNPEVNVSLAMAIQDGVVAPVVNHAHREPLGAIARQRKELTERARSGRLRMVDLTGGTFTISNLGMFHVDSFSAIITPPQAAILAVGAIKDCVVPVEGGIGVRPILKLTLSADHRVTDGAKAASFLQDLAGAMQEPEKWLA